MKKITASLFLLFLLIGCEDSSTTSTGQGRQVTPPAGNVAELCKDFDSRLDRLNQKRIELDTLLEMKDQKSFERIDEASGELSNLVHELQKDCG